MFHSKFNSSTPLADALLFNDKKRFIELLEKGIGDPNETTPEITKFAIIHRAVLSPNPRLFVSLLLKHNPDINQVDGRKKSALHYATERNLLDIVTLLLDKGADIHKGDSLGNTPLHLAVLNRKDSLELVRTLLKYNADANCSSHIGFTPITLVAGITTNIPMLYMLLSSLPPEMRLLTLADLSAQTHHFAPRMQDFILSGGAVRCSEFFASLSILPKSTHEIITLIDRSLKAGVKISEVIQCMKILHCLDAKKSPSKTLVNQALSTLERLIKSKDIINITPLSESLTSAEIKGLSLEKSRIDIPHFTPPSFKEAKSPPLSSTPKPYSFVEKIIRVSETFEKRF